MDKRWRNLGILVIVIVLIVALIFVVPLVINKSLTLDEGYAKIDALFLKNDVNLENVQNLTLVNGPNEQNVVVWVEKKNNVLALRKDLIDFNKSLYVGMNDPQVVGELSAITDLFVGAIDHSLLVEKEYYRFIPLIVDKNFSCTTANLEMMQDVNAEAFNVFQDYAALSEKNDSFKLTYDIYAEPLSISLANAITDQVILEGVINTFATECKVGTP